MAGAESTAGREEAGRTTRPETLSEVPALALSGLLGVPAPADSGEGRALPLLWHWLYLLERPAQSELGADGHPARAPETVAAGGAGELTARMFAGGRVTVTHPLLTGRPATRASTVTADVVKQGRSGLLRFVTHRHVYRQGGVAVVDEIDLVYRRPARPAVAQAGPADTVGQSVMTPSPGECGRLHLDPTPTLLFRFSALTYNAHRIHYDRDYARDVEGFPGLLVHGPLQALAMAEAARPVVSGRAASGRALRFEYRLLAPLFEGQGLVATATSASTGALTTQVRDRSGRTTASGSLTFG